MKTRLFRAVLLLLMLAVGFQFSVLSTPDAPPQAALAQGDNSDACQTLVRDALRTIGSACATLGTNEVCYGNTRVSATLTDPALLFEQTGDTVDVLTVDALITRPANPQTQEWGVALANLRADLPSASGETVRMVLFGDTQLAAERTDAAAVNGAGVTCQFENNSARGFNLRTGPGLDFRAVDVLDAGTALEVYGQSADGAWLRSARGWVAAELGTVVCEGDVVLPTFQDPADAYFAPMQAFSMTISASGNCDDAPSGLLVQAPDNRTANIRINGVEVRVGSTAVVFPTENADGLNFGNLGGTVHVTVNGATASPAPGQMSSVTIDENGNASGTPTAPTTLVGIDLTDEFLNEVLPAPIVAEPDAPAASPSSTNAPASTDSDGDGVLDANDPCPTIPNDPIDDPCNPDQDLDGILDIDDACPFIANDAFNDPCNNDEDGDGINDVDDLCPTVPGGTVDIIGDPCNADEDNDGVLDTVDECPNTPNDNAGADTCNLDEDNDGVPDVSDNCINDVNPDQTDSNNNGVGDACDSVAANDADGDGVLDADDRCNDASNPGTPATQGCPTKSPTISFGTIDLLATPPQITVTVQNTEPYDMTDIELFIQITTVDVGSNAVLATEAAVFVVGTLNANTAETFLWQPGIDVFGGLFFDIEANASGTNIIVPAPIAVRVEIT